MQVLQWANQNSKQELQKLESAENHVAGGKRGKIPFRLVTTGFCFALDWLKKAGFIWLVIATCSTSYQLWSSTGENADNANQYENWLSIEN